MILLSRVLFPTGEFRSIYMQVLNVLAVYRLPFTFTAATIGARIKARVGIHYFFINKVELESLTWCRSTV